MAYVLDATAIRSGMTFAGDEWFTTSSVINEVKLGRQARNLEILQETAIKVMEPDKDSMDKIEAAAKSTGDFDSLSKTEMEVLALALFLNAELISDDYSVQNIASVLKIPYKTDLAGIRKIIIWTYRCKGCGRYYEKMQPDCPICGSEIRRVKKK